MNLPIFSSKYAFALSVLTLTGAGSVAIAPAAQAATFDLDFNWSSLVKDGDTSTAGTALNAYDLDKKSGQILGGTKYSTTLGNIGSIWADSGITITGFTKNGRTSTDPLGLFNSNCLPRGGVSYNGFTIPCAISSNLGDNDLATGHGSYGTVNYNTIAQGNLLIFEENEGNGVPDDTIKGGIFLFEIAEGKAWYLEEIGLLDDSQGEITYTYRDGSTSTEAFTILGENELKFFRSAEKREIAKVAVKLNGSGGISNLRFGSLEAPTDVPEPVAVLGLVTFGAVFAGMKRRQ